MYRIEKKIKNFLKRKFTKDDRGGFTLIEMVCVVSIIMCLITMISPMLLSYLNLANKTARQAMTKTIYNAMASMETESIMLTGGGAFAQNDDMTSEHFLDCKEINQDDIAGYINMEELKSANIESYGDAKVLKVGAAVTSNGILQYAKVKYEGDDTIYIYPDGNTYTEKESVIPDSGDKEEIEYEENELVSGLYRNGTLVYDWYDLKQKELVKVENGTLLAGAKLYTAGVYDNRTILYDTLIIDEEVTSIGKSNVGTYPEGTTKFNYYGYSNGYSKYTAIFDGCTSLKSIVVPKSVTLIGDGVFQNCTSIRDVTIYGDVEIIGYGAFKNCSSLTSISFPGSLKTIGINAFSGCTALSSVAFNEGLEKIEAGAFSSCQSLVELNIPDSVKTIGVSSSTIVFLNGGGLSYHGAFSYCKSLESINLPDIEYIGYEMFYGCFKLSQLEIPETVKIIGSSAFADCVSLTSINVPDNVTSINSVAFKGCSRIVQIDIGKNVSFINSTAFPTLSTDYYCPASLKSDKKVFASINVNGENQNYCDIDGVLFTKNMETLLTMPSAKTLPDIYEVPSTVKYISPRAFYDCDSLKEISLPANLISIGENGFYNCDLLSSISIPYGVEKLESYVFDNCNKLSSVELPESIISIGYYCFRWCENLKEIAFPQSLLGIGDAAFRYSGLQSVEIPNSVIYVGSDAFYGCTSLKTVELSSSMEAINTSCFQYCSSLTSVTIPDGIKRVWGHSFYGCTSLKEITLPSTLESIGGIPANESGSVDNSFYNAFYGCTSLERVNIEGNSLTTVGLESFYGCKSLTDINLPNSLTTIGKSAFANCTAFSDLVVPDSVNSIGLYAFTGVPHVTYHGTAGDNYADKWGAVSLN